MVLTCCDRFEEELAGEGVDSDERQTHEKGLKNKKNLVLTCCDRFKEELAGEGVDSDERQTHEKGLKKKKKLGANLLPTGLKKSLQARA